MKREGQILIIDVTPAELRAAAQAPADPRIEASIVCVFEGEMPMSGPKAWQALLAKSSELGRMLTASETTTVLEAEGGHDAHP
jgi:hypothetical protein